MVLGHTAILFSRNWRDRCQRFRTGTAYKRACRKYPAMRYIYDAIDILQQVQIDLHVWAVESTARLLWNGNLLQRIIRWRQVNRIMHYMLYEERILAESEGKLMPRDGQIEAKETRAEWKQYAFHLHFFLGMSSTNQRRIRLFAAELFDAGEVRKATRLLRGSKQNKPKDHYLWNNLGVAFADFRHYAEAEEAYRKAIQLNPNDDSAYNNLGILLHTLRRYSEAETAYHKSIECAPHWASTYHNFGNLL